MKIGVVGGGMMGATAVYAIMIRGCCSPIQCQDYPQRHRCDRVWYLLNE
jgi:hypothetical protein